MQTVCWRGLTAWVGLVMACGASVRSLGGEPRTNEPLVALPTAASDIDAARARLGAKLFSDKRLSADGTVSCQSCHLPTAGGADPRRHSVSAFGKVREINSPSIFNVRYNTSGLNWNGRTPDLERQIHGSISNVDTMANSWPKVLAALSADQALVDEFKAVYGPDPFADANNAMNAIVSYERSLVTPSRFDEWLRGDDQAITAAEKAGYEKFKQMGYAGCHHGTNVGGNAYAKFGLFGDYFVDRQARGRGALVEPDKGRFLVTKQDSDLHVFRVAPLRNVALTAPYFHDGAVPTLDEAILLMGRHQLGREIEPADRQLIAQFLRSLTGKQLEKP